MRPKYGSQVGCLLSPIYHPGCFTYGPAYQFVLRFVLEKKSHAPVPHNDNRPGSQTPVSLFSRPQLPRMTFKWAVCFPPFDILGVLPMDQHINSFFGGFLERDYVLSSHTNLTKSSSLKPFESSQGIHKPRATLYRH